QGMHVEAGHADQVARPAEQLTLLHVVVPQHVAGVLTQETLDALAELLDAVNLFLAHAPGAVRRVGLARRERRDHAVALVVPGHGGPRVLDEGEGPHRLQDDRLVGGDRLHARQAHEPRPAVDLGRARAALAGLAVPAAGEVAGLRRLDLVDTVEHDHAFAVLDGVVLELAAVFLAAPDAKS